MYTVLAVCAAGAAAVVYLRRRFVVTVVRGDSMAPALRDGERVRARRCRTAPARGAVVVFRPPLRLRHDPAPGLPALRVKRVVAVAGDPNPLCTPGAGPSDDRPWERLRYVPPGHVVVLGDHEPSQDSRHFGFVAVGDVIAVVS